MCGSSAHGRAGSGCRGLPCLGGPVRRNAFPLLAALALVAAALFEAARHLLAWARAVVRELLRPQFLATRSLVLGRELHLRLASTRLAHDAQARAPPLPG